MMYTLAVCFTVYLHVSGRTHIMTALCVCVYVCPPAHKIIHKHANGCQSNLVGKGKGWPSRSD